MHYFRYIQKEFIKQFLPENPVIVEAGAHKGRDTLAFKREWPTSTIHAFEPVPKLYAKLRESTQHEPSIRCYNYALSNTTGTAQLYESDHTCDAISSLLQPDSIAMEKPNILFTSRSVNTITLNDWAKKYRIDKIDFLWLDTQGTELAVLEGAEHLLENIKAIHLEVATIERYTNQALYDAVKLFLEQHNFELVAEALYRKTWGNALFVKKN